jgi:superfamily II DNA/RNA helicase
MKQKIMRISNSINKTQRIIFSEQLTDRIDTLAEKMLLSLFFVEIEEEDEEEEEEEEEEE